MTLLPSSIPPRPRRADGRVREEVSKGRGEPAGDEHLAAHHQRRGSAARAVQQVPPASRRGRRRSPRPDGGRRPRRERPRRSATVAVVLSGRRGPLTRRQPRECLVEEPVLRLGVDVKVILTPSYIFCIENH
jgi:hypothetical protein